MAFLSPFAHFHICLPRLLSWVFSCACPKTSTITVLAVFNSVTVCAHLHSYRPIREWNVFRPTCLFFYLSQVSRTNPITPFVGFSRRHVVFYSLRVNSRDSESHSASYLCFIISIRKRTGNKHSLELCILLNFSVETW